NPGTAQPMPRSSRFRKTPRLPQSMPLRKPPRCEAHMLDKMTNRLDFLGNALTLRAERQRAIASNIANADTPGYVARDFDFSAALREATGENGASGSLGAAKLPTAAVGTAGTTHS